MKAPKKCAPNLQEQPKSSYKDRPKPFLKDLQFVEAAISEVGLEVLAFTGLPSQPPAPALKTPRSGLKFNARA